MALLPCYDKRGCDAYCCIEFWVHWDLLSFTKLLRIFPNILKKYCAKAIEIVGNESSFVIVPENFHFGYDKRKVSQEEWNYFLYMFEKDFSEHPGCVFLNREKRCDIYEHRPKVCRDYGETTDMPCKEVS